MDTTLQKFDLVIRNGRVIDPINDMDKDNCNVVIHNGKIAHITGCEQRNVPSP